MRKIEIELREANERVAELETALNAIYDEVVDAHDGAHILLVREICEKALSK